MTIAEAFEQRGEKRGAFNNSIEIAIELLKEGIDKTLVSKTTKLDMEKVEELSANLSSDTH